MHYRLLARRLARSQRSVANSDTSSSSGSSSGASLSGRARSFSGLAWRSPDGEAGTTRESRRLLRSSTSAGRPTLCWRMLSSTDGASSGSPVTRALSCPSLDRLKPSLSFVKGKFRRRRAMSNGRRSAAALNSHQAIGTWPCAGGRPWPKALGRAAEDSAVRDGCQTLQQVRIGLPSPCTRANRVRPGWLR